MSPASIRPSKLWCTEPKKKDTRCWVSDGVGVTVLVGVGVGVAAAGDEVTLGVTVGVTVLVGVGDGKVEQSTASVISSEYPIRTA